MQWGKYILENIFYDLTINNLFLFSTDITSPIFVLQVEAEKMKVYLTASGEKEGKEMKVKRKEMEVFDMEEGNLGEFCKERER